MDRRALKAAAREDLSAASCSPRRVTLVFLLLILALVVMDVAVPYLIERMGSSGHYLSDAISAGSRNYMMIVLFSLLCQAVLAMLTAGYTTFSLALSRREPCAPDMLWEGFHRAGAVLALYFLRALFIGLWAGVLSVPLSYLLLALLPANLSDAALYYVLLGASALLMLILSYRYRMAYFLLMDDPSLTARQALGRARAINQVHRVELFLLDLSFLPWMLLGLLTCGILLIWKLPYMLSTYARTYQYMLDDYRRRQDNLQDFLTRMQRGEP